MKEENLNSTSADSCAIEFRNVSLSFGERRVLDRISFKLEQGEMIAVTGESGSGKSVLLHLAIGLLQPDEGEIFINGREIENLSEEILLDIRGGFMGMVFQEDSLFTGLSVYDNVAFRPQEHGWTDEETDRAVTEALRFVGLEDEVDKLPEELSGGMKRRLEIARAVVGWPSILLFDEPTSSLDPINAEQVLNLVICARDVHHIASVYVTKKLHEIPYLATHSAPRRETGETSFTDVDERADGSLKVIMLEKGRIVFEGDYTEFEKSELPSVRHLTKAENGTVLSDEYFSNPWDKKREPKEGVY